MMYELIPHIELYKQQIYTVTIQATITLLDKLTSFSPKKETSIGVQHGSDRKNKWEHTDTYKNVLVWLKAKENHVVQELPRNWGTFVQIYVKWVPYTGNSSHLWEERINEWADVGCHEQNRNAYSCYSIIELLLII